MSGPFHPTGRAKVSTRHPRAIGVCNRCGFWYQRTQLRNQLQWQGLKLQPLNIYVCHTCYDRPQPQLKTIILPPDPLPVYLPFPEPFDVEVPSNMTTLGGTWFVTTSGVEIVMMSKVTPNPDPNNPVLFPLGF